MTEATERVRMMLAGVCMIKTFDSSPKWLKIAIALVCIFFILYVCFAPNIDLPDTTLQAIHAAVLLLAAIGLCSSMTKGLLLCSRGASVASVIRFERVLRRTHRLCDIHSRTC